MCICGAIQSRSTTVVLRSPISSLRGIAAVSSLADVLIARGITWLRSCST